MTKNHPASERTARSLTTSGGLVEEPFHRATLAALLNRFQTEGTLVTPRTPAGPRNHLLDVEGLGIAHCTIDRGESQTGCTAIAIGNPAPQNGVPCGFAVFNGFAKPSGLIQVQELGLLEGPILLGNTFAVGDLFGAGTRWAVKHAPETGRNDPTFNPVVLECNDGWLNDSQAFPLTLGDIENTIDRAYKSAATDWERGSVGAGRGMRCFGLKGGIGSASRIARIDSQDWTIGALVLANFGLIEDLTLDGIRVGPWLSEGLEKNRADDPEKGSIIMLLATDAPLDHRQLARCARRAGAGLARTGSFYGHGSGDIALAFSTASSFEYQTRLEDADLDPFFRASADAIEGAIVDALLEAKPVRGFRGRELRPLREALEHLYARIENDSARSQRRN